MKHQRGFRSVQLVLRTSTPHVWLALTLLVAACSQSPQQDENVADVLGETDAALQKAVADRNLERIMSFYANDAVLLPAAQPMLEGKKAIREEWAHILEIPDFQSMSSLIRVEVSGGGDLGYTMGTYVATMVGEDGKPITEPGKWLSVWKKQPDGMWRIAMDTYNTDIPPPDHK